MTHVLGVFHSEMSGEWYWHKIAGNNEVVSQGEGYTRRDSAIEGAFSANPEIDWLRVYDGGKEPYTVHRERPEDAQDEHLAAADRAPVEDGEL